MTLFSEPGGTVPGGYVDPQGRQFNNPSAYTPPVGG